MVMEQFLTLSVLEPKFETQQMRRGGEEKTRPVAWWPFHVLTPILQALGWGALSGVLLSRGIPRGWVAQHTVHKRVKEEGKEEGNARRTRGGWERGIGIGGDEKKIKIK